MKKQDLHIGDFVKVCYDCSTNGHILRVVEIRTISFKAEDLTDKRYGIKNYSFLDVEPVKFEENPILKGAEHRSSYLDYLTNKGYEI